MSDSSEDEDLSKFQEAVDNSFTIKNNISTQQNNLKPKSERYLEQSGHYNDVVVPEEVQRRIGAKVSQLIEKKIKFVTIDSEVKKRKIKGGVKLFTNSETFLSCDEPEDTYTEEHNKKSKILKLNYQNKADESNMDNEEKIQAVVVTPEQVISKEDTKCWKSRRKEKVFKYKGNGNSKLLTAVE